MCEFKDHYTQYNPNKISPQRVEVVVNKWRSVHESLSLLHSLRQAQFYMTKEITVEEKEIILRRSLAL